MDESDSAEFDQIAKFIPFYPSLTDPDFSYSLARKKEFRDLILPAEYAEGGGDLFRQQAIIKQFLSPATAYNELLIFHQVGAGKTATALAVAESWKTQSREVAACATKGKGDTRLKTPAQCPLIIVRNVDRFAPIFKKEIRERFPAFYSSPDATFAKNYEIESYRTAGRKPTYSNRVIIIDEAHNLQPQAIGGTDYKNLLAKLRGGVNSKKILLTGTPIPDQARQIIPLMNLILPEPLPRQAYDRFGSLYFRQGRFIPQSTLEPGDSRYDLTRQFRGRVSFFKTIIPGVSQETQGRRGVKILTADNHIIEIGQTIPVVCNVMSDFQYARAATYSAAGEAQDAFSQIARREATMTFEDSEQLPRKDFLKSLTSKETLNRHVKQMVPATLNTLKKYSATFYSILQDIRDHPDRLFFVYLDYVNGAGSQTNFGLVLEHFLKYTELGSKRRGGGKKYAILGFQKQMGAGAAFLQKLKKNRNPASLADEFAAGGRTQSPLEAEQHAQIILRVFNSPDNIKGQKIHVLVGGQKSGEGITIKNVTRVHLIPYWNFARPRQAVGRTIRPTSHNALIESRVRDAIALGLDLDDAKLEFSPLVGLNREFILEAPPGEEESYEDRVGRLPEFEVAGRDGSRITVAWKGTITVDVFYHVAVGPPSAPGLYRATQDVRVFHAAAQKYARTAQVLQFLKQISFDCPLTYLRNTAVGGGNYECYGFPAEEIEKTGSGWRYTIPPDRVQYDTYDFFYANEKEIGETLVRLFGRHSVLSFRQIVERTGGRPNPLLGGLQTLIGRSVPIQNRFGFRCCLREDRDMYFLVAFRDAFRDDQTYDQAIYAAIPFVTFRTSLQTLNDFRSAEETLTDLRTLCENPGEADAFKRLALQPRVRLLEEVYRTKDGEPLLLPPFMANALKDIYEVKDAHGGNVAVHVMLSKARAAVGSGYKTRLKPTGDMRILGAGGWRHAFPAEEELYLPAVVAQEKQIG